MEEFGHLLQRGDIFWRILFSAFGLLAWDLNDGQIYLFYRDYAAYTVYTEYVFREFGDDKTLETV